MRIALCVRLDKRLFRLVWINESKNGIYVGILGAKQESHASYHQDGNQHAKAGADYHNQFSDAPIAAHKGVKQLGHLSLPLTKNSFSPKMDYSGDEKTESLLLLDERLLWNKDTLALDLWLLDRASEPQLLDIAAKVLASDCRIQVLAELVSSLDNFPGHKIALTLRSARVREIEAAMPFNRTKMPNQSLRPRGAQAGLEIVGTRWPGKRTPQTIQLPKCRAIYGHSPRVRCKVMPSGALAATDCNQRRCQAARSRA